MGEYCDRDSNSRSEKLFQVRFRDGVCFTTRVTSLSAGGAQLITTCARNWLPSRLASRSSNSQAYMNSFTPCVPGMGPDAIITT